MRTIIIAEAGVNHNGSVDLAKKLVDAAAEAGADYVKFQTFKAEKIVSKDAVKAAYQIKTTGKENDSQLDMVRKLELNDKAHHTLIDHCKTRNIRFLSTPFDLESIEFLDKLGLKLFKIPSGEVTNYPHLQKIGGLGKDVVLSTGMANLAEVEEAVDVLIDAGTPRERITVLHCNSEYPTPIEDVNLKAMLTIAAALAVKVGYSDHTLGIEVPIAAVALGARIIEKHFTLDRNMEGPDHQSSLEPDELKKMVNAIRNIEKAMGDGVKEPSPSEQKNLSVVRRSIHLSRNLSAGHVLVKDDLIMKRPGDGIPPKQIERIVGKRVKRDLEEDHKLSFEDLE